MKILPSRTPSVDSALNALPTASAPLSPDEQKRILSLAMKKAAQKRVHTAPAPRRGRSKTLVRTAAFLAAACALSVGAFAAAPLVGELVRGKIGFFTDAKAQSQVQNPMDAPRGDYTGQQADLESHNMAVGQTVTLNGVSYTLDTVSMDSASLDCFFTISGENVVENFLDSSLPQPEWYQLDINAPRLLAQINGGEAIARMQSDLYRKNDDSFQYWAHFQLPAEPQGDTITLTLSDSAVLIGEDGLRYTVQLNGEQVRAGARHVEPAALDFGLSDVMLGDNPITLDSLYFGTGSGTLVTHSAASDAFDAAYPSGIPAEEYETRYLPNINENSIDFSGAMILTDDTGKQLLPSYPCGVVPDSTAYTLPAENAQSITFTPVYHKGEYQYETRTVTTAEMQQGVKIATSDVGGYTLQNFKAQGQALTWQAVPYGFSVHNPEFFPQDEAYIDTNSNSYALVSRQVDPTTGIISYRQDYYTADPAQVAKISEFRYTFSTGYAADESKAITLPLVK